MAEKNLKELEERIQGSSSLILPVSAKKRTNTDRLISTIRDFYDDLSPETQQWQQILLIKSSYCNTSVFSGCKTTIKRRKFKPLSTGSYWALAKQHKADVCSTVVRILTEVHQLLLDNNRIDSFIVYSASSLSLLYRNNEMLYTLSLLFVHWTRWINLAFLFLSVCRITVSDLVTWMSN